MTADRRPASTEPPGSLADGSGRSEADAQPEANAVRRLWHRFEHLHAVTYFHPTCRESNEKLGLRGFWMGYFGSRAAPLGPVGPGVVTALFSNFAPAMVERSIPDAWSYADPATIVETRGRAAAAALRDLVPTIERVAADVCGRLADCVETAPSAGRPLFAANREVGTPADPVAHLWQLCTSLREHRGDAHVSVLGLNGLTGCEPHLLFALDAGCPEAVLRDNRGWSEAAWEQARNHLSERGLIGPDGMLSGTGRRLRHDVEVTTDRLAGAAYGPCDAADLEQLAARLLGSATEISASGVIPYPNPIGLPAPA